MKTGEDDIIIIESVVVFCGSKSGTKPIFSQRVQELGQELAEENITLIYGGGNRGLMGDLAHSVLRHGGKAIGITPEALHREHTDFQLTETIVVPDIHTRNRMLYERSDAAIVCPGGFGTLYEAAEFLTWSQLKFHDGHKPICFLNSGGFFKSELDQFDRMVKEGFLSQEDRELVLEHRDPGGVLSNIRESFRRTLHLSY